MLRMLQISLTTVGVGDPDRSAPIPIADDDGGAGYLIHDGEEVRSRMRSGLLVGMAEAAGGAYVNGHAGPIRLDVWYADHLADQPRREYAPATSKELGPQYGYFVLLAIVLLLIETALRRARGDAA
jgi:hypothetical protein